MVNYLNLVKKTKAFGKLILPEAREATHPVETLNLGRLFKNQPKTGAGDLRNKWLKINQEQK